jgi:hypothetical protein
MLPAIKRIYFGECERIGRRAVDLSNRVAAHYFRIHASERGHVAMTPAVRIGDAIE